MTTKLEIPAPGLQRKMDLFQGYESSRTRSGRRTCRAPIGQVLIGGELRARPVEAGAIRGDDSTAPFASVPPNGSGDSFGWNDRRNEG